MLGSMSRNPLADTQVAEDRSGRRAPDVRRDGQTDQGLVAERGCPGVPLAVSGTFPRYGEFRARDTLTSTVEREAQVESGGLRPPLMLGNGIGVHLVVGGDCAGAPEILARYSFVTGHEWHTWSVAKTA